MGPKSVLSLTVLAATALFISFFSVPRVCADIFEFDQTTEAIARETTPAGEETVNEKGGADDSGTYKAAGPGWIFGKASAVSPREADAYYAARKSKLPVRISTLSTSGRENARVSALSLDIGKQVCSKQLTADSYSTKNATNFTVEIAELARALVYDPLEIYNYVRMFIDYVPYFGSTKGATLTLSDKNGNDFDQASLMIALLRASGYKAQYVYGTMTIPELEASYWLAVSGLDSIDDLLSFGGVPHTISRENGTVTLNRVWVKATIDNTDYVFDPAFKSYCYYGRMDVGQAMGYSRDEFMAAATQGATVEDDYAQNINEANVREKMAQYSMNLVDSIRRNYPNHDVMEVFGGRKIQEDYSSELITSLPFEAAVTAVWDNIPAKYATIIKIEIPYLGITWAQYTHDLGGMALYISMKGKGIPTTRAISMTITLDHPYTADGGTYGDQSAVYTLHGEGLYVIPYSFGRGISDNRVQVRKEKLDKMLADDSSTQDDLIVETLAIMGLVYIKEFSTASNRLDTLFDRASIYHHSIGLLVQEDSYYIDFKNIYASNIFFGREGMTDREYFRSGINTQSVFISAFEHTVLEQTMGSDKPAVSTIKLLQIANATGRKVFRAIDSSFAAIKPQLQGYSTADLNGFQTKVGNGYTLILPDSGQLVLDEWKGKGYVETEFTDATQTGNFSMIIGGGLFGGYSTSSGDVEPTFYDIFSTSSSLIAESTHNVSTGQDPVDMSRGAFMSENTDLALGNGAPGGLAMVRSYDTDRRYNNDTMGYGWTHNNDISLKLSSYAEPVLGDRQPVDAASFIAAMYVIRDLMKAYDNTACAWVVSALAGKWAADLMIDNAVTVNMGKKGFEYIKLPDGTYAPPPGVTTRLAENTDGTFSLIERFGTRMDFNTDRKVSGIKDIDDNTMTFAYDTDKNLTSIRDAVGRTLTFSYSSGRIDSVADSAGRSVSYTYDADGNLTGHTDPEGKTWSYGYDSDHRITTVKNPLDITTATNTYDGLGRVNSQESPRQGGVSSTYLFFFSDYWNIEAAPVPGQTDTHYFTTYHYDDKKREWAHLDTLGFWKIRTYDGQDHVIRTTDALLSGRGKGTAYTYDADHNLIEMTDALGHPVKNSYDDRFRLIDTTDPLGNTTRFTYDDKHHLLTTSDPLNNAITSTYLASGLKGTVTDARGAVTRMTYDPYYNPSTARTGDHEAVTYTYDTIGRMTSLTDNEGATTTFTYDRRGLLLKATDPLLRTTSFTYDDAGRMTSVTDRNDRTTTYAYTPSDKVERITYHDGSSVDFTYNALDNLISMRDPAGTTEYTYDAVNRITSQTDPGGFVVRYAYDQAGNLTELTYPGDRKVIYTYDDLYRVKTVRIDWLDREASYTYDEAGHLISLTNFNGTVTDYEYDNAGRPTAIDNRQPGGAAISGYRFTLDQNGNRTGIVQEEPYRAAVSQQNISYTYNLRKNRLLSAGGNSFAYDDEGQLTEGYGTTYAFDNEHRLTGIGSAVRFTYSGAGNRIEAVRNGITTRYIYDAKGNLLAEADESGTITRYYIYGKGLLAMATPDNKAYSYHYNATGSTVAVTDDTGTMVNSYSYGPFGNITNRSETIPNPFTFVGQFGVMEEPNGFYYMRARYYDPDTGRFVSEDPKGFGGGDVNLYVYVGNNPVMGIDPEGTCGYEPPSGNYGEIRADRNTFLDNLKSDIRMDLYNVVNDPEPNARAYTLTRYLAEGVLTAVGSASSRAAILGEKPVRAFIRWETHQISGYRNYGKLSHLNFFGSHIHKYNWYKPWRWWK